MSLDPEDFKPIPFKCLQCGRQDYEMPSWDRGLWGKQIFCGPCDEEGDTDS